MGSIAKTKTKPFKVTRIPSPTGEWTDLHLGEDGKVYMTTTGYVEVDPSQFLDVIKSLKPR